VEHEDRGDEQRRPRDVEDRQQHRRGQQPLHRFQVALRGHGGGIIGHQRRALHRGGEDPAVEPVLEPGPDAGHHAPAGIVQQAHRNEEAGDEDRQGDQRFLGPAGDDAVIDLQHVERTGQHQQVDEHRKDEHGDEQAPAFAACGLQFVAASGVFCLRHVTPLRFARPMHATDAGEMPSRCLFAVVCCV